MTNNQQDIVAECTFADLDDEWTITDHPPARVSPPYIDELRRWSTLRLVRVREHIDTVLKERRAA